MDTNAPSQASRPSRPSRTAVLVAQGRAVADGRLAVGRFSDPAAITLLRDDERVPVELVRAGTVPTATRDRMNYEMVQACAEVMVPRTVAIDDAIAERAAPQVVILGAGLDSRAWRMGELAGVPVFEVDQPASQQDKRMRAIGLEMPKADVRFVAVDFGRDRLDAALEEAGHDAGRATTWVWEGVVPYLTRPEVRDTMRVVSMRSAPGSRLVVCYQLPALTAVFGRLVARAMARVADQPDPWAHEPRRSGWTAAAMRELLAANGFIVRRDEDLLALAGALPIEIHHRRSLQASRVAVADR
jgi:methyltransferase (TIGR00027 family)